ncbi:MAG: hypothetical protein ISS38_03145 [Candidatus Cloacimonetes bacterium]|nr:hypothetical protein [Candidatus Cloacimonadota bacterium]
MNKKILLLLCFLIIFVTLIFGKNKISYRNKIEIKNYYNSNIINLSESQLTEFFNSENQEKYHIKTADDFITSLKYEFRIKHSFPFGHTQIDKLIFKRSIYYNNEIKDNSHFGAEIRQYFSRNFNITFKYFYYPKIYVNHYESVLDEGNYHEFSYSKNYYNSILRWKISNNVRLDYQFKFSQFFHNGYFTEYDANCFESVIGSKIISTENSKLYFRYSYKISKAQAEKAFENLAEIDEIKDPSYESNIYYFSFSTPINLKIFSSPLKFSSNVEFEERFYQSNQALEIDPYHFGRNDKIFEVESFLKCSLSGIKLKLFYKYKTRKTSSAAGNFVEEDKEYSKYEIGFTIEKKFNF